MFAQPRVLLAVAVILTLGSTALLVVDGSLVAAWLTLVAGVSLAVAQAAEAPVVKRSTMPRSVRF